MMRASLLCAISRCISARSAASNPSPSMRWAGAPICVCGSRPMPCVSRLRWSMRASMSSSARRSLTCSAHRSRHRSTISVRFQSRTFWPKPLSSTLRMVSMTWAWGLGVHSSAMSQCTLRSAIMPSSTNSSCTKPRASSMPWACVISRGGANSTSRASWASFLTSNASTSFQTCSRSLHCSGASFGSMTSEWTTPRLLEKSWLPSSRSSRIREAER